MINFKEKKNFRYDAIVKCQSIVHPEVTIMAVPCNGVPECHNDVDEPWICKNMIAIISEGVFGICIGLLMIFSYVKFKSLKRKNKDTKFGLKIFLQRTARAE